MRDTRNGISRGYKAGGGTYLDNETIPKANVLRILNTLINSEVILVGFVGRLHFKGRFGAGEFLQENVELCLSRVRKAKPDFSIVEALSVVK